MPSLLILVARPLLRESLAALCARDGWRRVVEAASPGQALHALRAVAPVAVLIDESLLEDDGALAGELRRTAPRARFVVLGSGGRVEPQRLRALGAAARLQPDDGAAELLAALRGGRTDSGPAPTALSVRERQVLRLLAGGERVKDAARSLGLSPKTVETYRTRLKMKIGADHLPDLVKYAIRSGLTPLDD